MPLDRTEATAGFELLHVTDCPDIATPPSSSTTAASCTESPITNIAGLTVMLTAPIFGTSGPVESLHANDSMTAATPAAQRISLDSARMESPRVV